MAWSAAKGRTDKEVAYDLGIEASTVATHLGAAMRKLGVTSRVALLALLLAFPQDAPDDDGEGESQ